MSLELLTPTATMNRAQKLLNAFASLMLALNARPSMKKQAYPRYLAYVEYYMHLKNNLAARLTEFTQLDGWTKEYAALRTKAAKAGVDLSKVPYIKPAGVLHDVIPDIPDIPDPEEYGEQTKGAVLLGVGALVLGGMILYFVTRQ